MTFIEAMQICKHGSKVALPQWPRNDYLSWYESFQQFRRCQSTHKTWTPTESEFYSQEWMVVGEDK